MTSLKPLPPFDMVLFGGTGDLVMRKLLPALYRRQSEGQIQGLSRIIGAARSALTRAEYLAQIEGHCRSHLHSGFDDSVWQQFRERIDYVKLDATVADDFRALAQHFRKSGNAIRVFFLSTASDLFAPIVQGLARENLVTPDSRVVLEKPLGHDFASAEYINECVGSIFREERIYRIDHYLGKETVQNLLALRFGNVLFEPLWRRGRIRHVQITVAEQLGVETRAPFYERTGALRDMVQNHVLQLLCIIAMEPPASGDPDAVRDEKLKVLRALRPLTDGSAIANTVRGQYKAGAVNGAPVRGYLEERGVAADSRTETFVALKAEIDTWRWAGVPFYLRTGKRVQEKLTEIVVTFEDVPHSIFQKSSPQRTPNKLVIQLQPEESMLLAVSAKQPGEAMKLTPVSLSLDFAETFKTPSLDAYERLLMDTVKGNLTLFMRRDELDAAWRWIDPIREAWEQQDEGPRTYIAGTWGPAASSALLGRDGFAWHGE